MGEMSPWHWAIVIGVALLLFGAKRLPDAARSLGRSARILRAEMRSDDAPTTDSGESTAAPAPAPSQTAATVRDTTAPPSTS